MNTTHINHDYLLRPTRIFLLFAVIIAIGGFALIDNIKANEKEDTNRTLASIGQLKVNQIESYLAQRRSDASVVSGLLATSASQVWLSDQGAMAPAELGQLAESIAKAYQYRGLLLLDASANVRMNTRLSGLLTDTGKAMALRAMRDRSPAAFHIYLGDPSTPDVPVLDTFVPLMSPDGTAAVGMIVMRSELTYLFRLLQTWPVESETAELLLVKKEGDEVVFLNELRHWKGTAAKLRFPLSTDPNSPAWPAISSVGGQFGSIEARDYRNEPVLAYTIAVPDTPWNIVVKMDVKEAVAHSLRLLRISQILIAAFLSFTGIIVWMWWRNNKAERLANRQLQESEARYRRLHESMMDAFIIVDMSGRLIEFNHAFQEMVGYSSEELRNMAYHELAPDKWREFEMSIAKEQVVPHGQSQVYEKEYFRKDGTVFPAEIKAFLLRNENGEPEAIWTIVRDITERKLAQLKLQHSEDLLNEAQRLGQIGSWELNLDSGALRWSDEVYRIFELDAAQFSPSYENFLNVIHPDDRDEVNRAYTQSLIDREPYDVVHRLLFADGRIKWVREHCNTVFDASGKPLRSVGAVQDISRQKLSEETIAKEAEKFRVLFESISDAVLITNMKGRFIQVNHSACDRLGYSAEEFLQMGPADIDTPEYAAKVPERFRELREKGELVFESEHVRKDGAVIPIEISARAVTYDGEPAILSVARDITERKRAETALQQVADRIELLLNSVAEGIYGVDSQGKCTFINPAGLQLLGYHQESDLLGRNMHEVIHHTRKDGSHYPAGECRLYSAMHTQLGVHVDDELFWRKDGSSFAVDYWSRPLMLNGESGAVVTFLDITERKRTEEQVRKSSTEIADLYNNAPCGYHSLDKDGNIRLMNDTELSWLGYTRDEVVGKMRWMNLLAPASIMAFKKAHLQFIQQGFIRDFEAEIVRKDGTTFVGLVNASAVCDKDGHYLMSRSTVIDITERKRVKRQLQLLSAHLQTVREEEKASIAREIHDDLGGTLTALKIEAFRLEGDLAANKAATPLLKRVNSMSQLLDNAVDVTRRVITELRPTILDDLGLLAALEWQAAQFQKHTGIRCRVNCVEDKARLNKQHSIALFRIFQETLTNVARHSGATRVEVEFHSNDEEAVLTISDNGHGMTTEQAVASSSFGLRGMRERVEQLGGTISFESPPKGGFVVAATLPLHVERTNEEQV